MSDHALMVRTSLARRSSIASAEFVGVWRLRHADIPALCDLFGKTFRKGRTPRTEDLARCFEETYLGTVGDRESPASLVDVDAGGRVQGFMGIMTLAARFGEERLRGGVLGNFMACETDRARVGFRLARAMTRHGLDFLFTDTANQVSVGLARAIGFQNLPLQSLEWVKILRPCETASFMAGRRVPVLGAALRPMAYGADVIARRLPLATVLDQGHEVIDRPIDPRAFAAKARVLLERFSLRPDWDNGDLPWLLAQAGLKTRNGPLHMRDVTDRNGDTLGLYLLYARPGGVAQTLQILAKRNQESTVLKALIIHAHEIGAVAVRGQIDPRLSVGLMTYPGIIYHHVMASIVYTRRPDLAAAFGSSDAFVGGLLGESWTRLIADEFTTKVKNGHRDVSGKAADVAEIDGRGHAATAEIRSRPR